MLVSQVLSTVMMQCWWLWIISWGVYIKENCRMIVLQYRWLWHYRILLDMFYMKCHVNLLLTWLTHIVVTAKHDRLNLLSFTVKKRLTKISRLERLRYLYLQYCKGVLNKSIILNDKPIYVIKKYKFAKWAKISAIRTAVNTQSLQL